MAIKQKRIPPGQTNVDVENLRRSVDSCSGFSRSLLVDLDARCVNQASEVPQSPLLSNSEVCEDKPQWRQGLHDRSMAWKSANFWWIYPWKKGQLMFHSYVGVQKATYVCVSTVYTYVYIYNYIQLYTHLFSWIPATSRYHISPSKVESVFFRWFQLKNVINDWLLGPRAWK